MDINGRCRNEDVNPSLVGQENTVSEIIDTKHTKQTGRIERSIFARQQRHGRRRTITGSQCPIEHSATCTNPKYCIKNTPSQAPDHSHRDLFDDGQLLNPDEPDSGPGKAADELTPYEESRIQIKLINIMY